MDFTWECEHEVEDRWIAEVPELPDVLAYDTSSGDAIAKAEVLALHGIADQLENGESEPISSSLLPSIVCMSKWPSAHAKRVMAALQSTGWSNKRQTVLHRTLEHNANPDLVLAFHDGEEIGPRMLARSEKHLEPHLDSIHIHRVGRL